MIRLCLEVNVEVLPEVAWEAITSGRGADEFLKFSEEMSQMGGDSPLPFQMQTEVLKWQENETLWIRFTLKPFIKRIDVTFTLTPQAKEQTRVDVHIETKVSPRFILEPLYHLFGKHLLHRFLRETLAEVKYRAEQQTDPQVTLSTEVLPLDAVNFLPCRR